MHKINLSKQVTIDMGATSFHSSVKKSMESIFLDDSSETPWTVRFDFSNLDQMTESGTGILNKMVKLLESHGCHLIYLNMSKKVEKMLRSKQHKRAA